MFGFLKDKLKKTIDIFTKGVDKEIKETEEISETGKIKETEEISETGKIKETEEIKIAGRQKKSILAEKKELDEEKSIDVKIAEGEKEIEDLNNKQKEETHNREITTIEKKGFFSKLREKILQKKKEEIKEKYDAFEATKEELKDFEETFKETEKEIEKDEGERLIPVVTEDEKGETLFELKEKPGSIKGKKKEIEKNVEENKGILGALKDTIFKTSISEEKFEELFWNIEVVLLENNVAIEVIDLIKVNLKKELVQKKILRGHVEEIIMKTLKESIEQTFAVESIDLIKKIKGKKPCVIVFVGINGSGKTTTIAKIIQKLKDNKISCVVAASDTFRAAAIQQLEEHTTKLKVKLIKHDYGSDPAAVGFDAVKYAEAHSIDCVLIDTAGRLHSNTNLMDEMKKIIRITKPDIKLFIGEAITGNDCVEQARRFNEAIGIDGIILAKADIDEKGGAALSISYITQKPILFFGTGQTYMDLEEFEKDKVVEQLGL